ncbi:hypothetical protein ACNKHR_04895 [Shigella flexneri]
MRHSLMALRMRSPFPRNAAQHEAEPARCLGLTASHSGRRRYFVAVYGTLLNPVVAGAAMALSSITVVSNVTGCWFKLKE